MNKETQSRHGQKSLLLPVIFLVMLSITVQSAVCLAGPLPQWLTKLVASTDGAKPPTSTVATSRAETWWLGKHEALKKQAAAGNVGLLFIGDSITEGMNGVHDLMDHYWGSYRPANFGISGDTTEHLLWRMQNGEFKGLKPSVTVVLIGTNNLARDTDDEVVAGVKADIDELRRQLPSTKVLLLAILPRGDESARSIRIRIGAINERLSKLADNKHVFYTDISSKLLSTDGTVSRDIMPDYLHPSRKGYELMFKGLKPPLSKLLK
jgi:lysophospholipase L1-like esterase